MTKIDEIFDKHWRENSYSLESDIKLMMKDYAEWAISRTLEELSEEEDVTIFIPDNYSMGGGYHGNNRDFIKKFRINDIL